jgi:hypothetical protein
MNALFPELRDSLATEAERQVRPSRRLHLPIVGGGLLAVLAAGGIATAATGIWSPPLGDDRRGNPTPSVAPVPEAQLRHFAVLRRQADDQDRGADVRSALTFMSPKYEGIRVNAVRRLAAGDGTAGADILIPVGSANGIRDALCLFTTDPVDGGGVNCFSLPQILTGHGTAAIAKMAPPTEAQRRSMQATAAKAKRAFSARRRAALRAAQPLPRDPAARTRAIRAAYRKADRRSARTATPTGPAPSIAQIQYSGIVPDGVATVVRHDSAGTHRATVANNFYRMSVPKGRPGDGTFVWQDSQGLPVRTTADR